MKGLRQRIAYWIYPQARISSMEVSQMIEIRATNRKLIEELKIERRQREDIDPKNIMRQLLGLVSVDVEAMNDLYHGLTIDEIREFHYFGFALAKNRWWKHLRAHALNTQAAKTLKGMLINERHAWIGGGTINGIMLLDEQVERLRAAHEEDVKPQEGFDKNNAIPE